MVYTETQLNIFRISAHARLSDGEILEKLIKEDMQSIVKDRMRAGRDYYEIEHDILDEDFTQWKDPQSGKIFGSGKYNTLTNPNKANNRIPHPFFRLQALEKISYLLKEEPTITWGDNMETDAEKANAETVRDRFVDVLRGEDQTELNDTFSDWGMDSTTRGRGLLHIYFEDFKFKKTGIDPIECILIFDTSRQKKLEQVIRYYSVTVNEAGDQKERTRAEWYFPNSPTQIWQEDKDGNFVLEETRPHFTIRNTASEGATPGFWGRVPFIDLKNNSKCISDLRAIKALIDAFDLANSKFANDLEDLQEAIIKATGTDSKPDEIRRNLFYFKVWATSATAQEADLDKLEIAIPYEAKKVFFEQAKNMIAHFGMAVNWDENKFGQNPSGVALMFMYSLLDLKASLLERKFIPAIKELFWFVNRYFELTNQNPLEEKQLKQFHVKFNKSMIANVKEQAELANASVGKISEKTRLATDPRVEDVDDEMTRMEEDGQKKMDKEIKRFEQMPPVATNGNGELNVRT